MVTLVTLYFCTEKCINIVVTCVVTSMVTGMECCYSRNCLGVDVKYNVYNGNSYGSSSDNSV